CLRGWTGTAGEFGILEPRGLDRPPGGGGDRRRRRTHGFANPRTELDALRNGRAVVGGNVLPAQRAAIIGVTGAHRLRQRDVALGIVEVRPDRETGEQADTDQHAPAAAPPEAATGEGRNAAVTEIPGAGPRAPHPGAARACSAGTRSAVARPGTSPAVARAGTSSAVTRARTSPAVARAGTSSAVTRARASSAVTRARTSSAVARARPSPAVTRTRPMPAVQRRAGTRP